MQESKPLKFKGLQFQILIIFPISKQFIYLPQQRHHQTNFQRLLCFFPVADCILTRRLPLDLSHKAVQRLQKP